MWAPACYDLCLVILTRGFRMDTTATVTAVSEAPEATADEATDGVELIDEELLVEEISIDGMCGVY